MCFVHRATRSAHPDKFIAIEPVVDAAPHSTAFGNSSEFGCFGNFAIRKYMHDLISVHIFKPIAERRCVHVCGQYCDRINPFAGLRHRGGICIHEQSNAPFWIRRLKPTDAWQGQTNIAYGIGTTDDDMCVLSLQFIGCSCYLS